MALTRKHFSSIASAIHGAINNAETDEARESVAGLAEDLIGLCQSENPRFDVDRFAQAAGLEWDNGFVVRTGMGPAVVKAAA